jgi:acetyl-CoA synthase
VSKIIASAAIRGAHKIAARVEKKYAAVLQKYGPEQEIGFPDTAYYLPIIYAMLGIPVKNLGDCQLVFQRARKLLPAPVHEKVHLPYLAPALDAGMATLFYEEIEEAIRYLEQPDIYLRGEEVTDDNIWLGAANDVIMRKRGVEFVDGTAPGFAAVVGAAPDKETAARIAHELQLKNLYVFMGAENNGVRFSQQLVEAGVQIGWNTRLVSFGPDVSACVFALGFACRAAMAFGGVAPGDFRKNLIYNKDRIFAFVLALGFVSDEWYANAAGAINYGFPVIADTPIPEVLPTGICTYEHVVSNIPHDQMVAKAIEVRGLKVTVTEVPIPLAYGPAFEGERVRGDDIHLECGGGRTQMVEFSVLKRMDEVEDGKIEIVGKDITDMPSASKLPLAIYVTVAGRQMQEDFLPILERQIHHLVNYAQGLMHIGQRDIAWVRIAKQAVEKGFSLKHIGTILHAMYHKDFGKIVDKVQVTIYTD